MSRTTRRSTDAPAAVRQPGTEARAGLGVHRPAGAPVEKSKDFGRNVRRLMRRLAPERALLAAVAVLAIGSVTLSVLGPRLLGRATDVIVDGAFGSDAGEGIDFAALHRILLVVLVLYLAGSALAYAQSYLLAGVVQRSMRSLRSDVEQKLARLPLSTVDRMPRGDLLSRVTNDIDNLAQSMQQSLSQLLTSVLSMTGVAVMMVVISPVLSIVAAVMIPLSLWTMKRIAAMARPRFMDQWRHTGALNAQVEEAFTGHAVVKAFGRQRHVEDEFRAKNDELYAASVGAQLISGTIQPMMMFLGNVAYVAVAVVGGVRVSGGALSVGDVQAFLQYTRQFTMPLTQVASMVNVMQSGVASAERIFELLDEPEEAPDAADAPTVTDPRGRVEFANVRFSYDPDQPLIEDLSFTAHPGRTVAIVGPTGAGKTTLVNLIMRFYELQGGRIELDGVDIAAMRRDDLRSRIGMVLQDTWLFGGTIRDNIAYGRPGAPEEQIVEAARATYVDRFVRALPDGYDTLVDDEGGRLSAGEKQLVTIARAFLADPQILILDEATSSVDTRTEVLIQHAMAALRSSRTSFVIAHRLSTIRDADVILVMEAGRIVETGSHDELLAIDGAYARLYRSQFAAAAAPVD